MADDDKAEFALRLIDRITRPAKNMARAIGVLRKSSVESRLATDANTASVKRTAQAMNQVGAAASKAAAGVKALAAAQRQANAAGAVRGANGRFLPRGGAAVAAAAGPLPAGMGRSVTGQQGKLDKNGRLRASDGRFLQTKAQSFMRGGDPGQAPQSRFQRAMRWNYNTGKKLDQWGKAKDEFMDTPFGRIGSGLGKIAGGIGGVALSAAEAAIKVGALAAALGGIAAGALVKAVTEQAMFAERARLSLTALSGGAAAGEAAFQRARTIAEELGVSVNDTTQKFIELRAAQFSSGQAEELIKLSADLQTVTGHADAAERAIRAITQIKAKGRVQSEELLQLSEAGLSLDLVMGELEKSLGTNRKGVQKQLMAGAVDAGKGIDAIRAAIMHKLGEKTAGDVAKKFSRTTLTGIWTRLKTLPERLFLNIGEMIDLGPLKTLAETVTSAFGEINQRGVATFVENLIARFKDLVEIGLEFARGFGEGFAELTQVLGQKLPIENIKGFARAAGKWLADMFTEIVWYTNWAIKKFDEWAPKIAKVFDPAQVRRWIIGLNPITDALLTIADKFGILSDSAREFFGLLAPKKKAGPGTLPTITPFADPNAATTWAKGKLEERSKLRPAAGSAFPNAFQWDQGPARAPQWPLIPKAAPPMPVASNIKIGDVNVVVPPGGTGSPEEVGKAVRKEISAYFEEFADRQLNEAPG